MLTRGFAQCDVRPLPPGLQPWFGFCQKLKACALSWSALSRSDLSNTGSTTDRRQLRVYTTQSRAFTATRPALAGLLRTRRGEWL